MLLLSWVYERTLTSVSTLPHHSPAQHSHGDVGPGPSPARSGVVVDWSDLAPGVDGVQPSVDELIRWVGTCPRPSGIRVYLPPVRHRAAMQKLRRSLLSLGVTVTCRMRPA